jgi:hypothetical protein
MNLNWINIKRPRLIFIIIKLFKVKEKTES